MLIRDDHHLARSHALSAGSPVAVSFPLEAVDQPFPGMTRPPLAMAGPILIVSIGYAMLNQGLSLSGIYAGAILLVRRFVWPSIDDHFRDGSTTQTRGFDNWNQTEL